MKAREERKRLIVWALKYICKSKDEIRRILIGVSGIPGSGKTTLVAAVTERVNHLRNTEVHFAVWFAFQWMTITYPNLSWPLCQTQQPPIHRRGAAFTFDVKEFYRFVQRLREPLASSSSTFYAPGFDHAIKDPIMDDIAILPESRVVIFEGLYLSLNRELWSSAAALMDDSCFIEVDREIARERLAKRHVISGIVSDDAAAEQRTSSTDFLNADDIIKNRLYVEEKIPGG
ncbi:hypothetical protein N7450_000017 [Penicillium hetheringtonii]|uniref:Phosphoribulokinase/uridine kinase domain-containing protein n=1 Tax=Penicillium hetheringtonii TaxID=911720 RepID=A0AAD6H262_9EURO|nr:hypothetical protein N7450_000017 [Penicillium hetheringtonii]